jgi:hypothetical protein
MTAIGLPVSSKRHQLSEHSSIEYTGAQVAAQRLCSGVNEFATSQGAMPQSVPDGSSYVEVIHASLASAWMQVTTAHLRCFLATRCQGSDGQ